MASGHVLSMELRENVENDTTYCCEDHIVVACNGTTNQNWQRIKKEITLELARYYMPVLASRKHRPRVS